MAKTSWVSEGANIVMAALFKYFVGIAVILAAVVILYAVNMGEMFVGIAAIAQAPVTETPRWQIEPVKAEPDTPYRSAWNIKPDLTGNSRQRAFGKTSVHRNACRESSKNRRAQNELMCAKRYNCTSCLDKYMRQANKT